MKRASARNDRVTSKCLTHDTSATTEVAGAFKTRRHTDEKSPQAKRRARQLGRESTISQELGNLGVAKAEARKVIRVIR